MLSFLQATSGPLIPSTLLLVIHPHHLFIPFRMDITSGPYFYSHEFVLFLGQSQAIFGAVWHSKPNDI
jgi:hypothetical protein